MKFFTLPLFILSCQPLYVAASLRKPVQLANDMETSAERELQLKLAGRPSCEEQLAKCQATVVGDVPVKQWASELSSFEGTPSEESAKQLKQIVLQSGSPDFSSVVKSSDTDGNFWQTLKVLKAVDEFNGQESPLDQTKKDNIVKTINAINDVLKSTVGGISDQQDITLIIEFVIFILEFIVGLIGVYPDGPAAIVMFLVQEFISFITTFVIGMMSSLFGASESDTCKADVLACEYKKMMFSVFPASVGAFFVANGSPPSNTAADTPSNTAADAPSNTAAKGPSNTAAAASP